MGAYERERELLRAKVRRSVLGDDANVFEAQAVERGLRHPDAARGLAEEVGLDEHETFQLVKGAKAAHRADVRAAEADRFWGVG
jgi:hypothetical protein